MLNEKILLKRILTIWLRLNNNSQTSPFTPPLKKLFYKKQQTIKRSKQTNKKQRLVGNWLGKGIGEISGVTAL